MLHGAWNDVNPTLQLIIETRSIFNEAIMMCDSLLVPNIKLHHKV